ncbi:MAG: toll/interleukin-1 receptor domain-containing protein [Bacteroidota bacterium]
MKEWDVFISHASEDKLSVALPLYDRLKAAGLRVWLDRFELKIGDSLREKIDEGLALSRYGVVVLSQSFLAKRWPARELNGLFAREEAGRKVLLPVWHELTKETLAQTSPMLADRLAGNTAQGMEAVASAIIDVVMHDASSPANATPLLSRRLVELLETTPKPSAVRDFLSAHPGILASALGMSRRSQARHSITLGGVDIDFCLGEYQPTKSQWSWKLVMLHPVVLGEFGRGGDVPVSLKRCVDKLAETRAWVSENPGMASALLQDLRSDFAGIVLAGRRNALSAQQRSGLSEFNDLLVGVRVRSYDSLVDAATN